MPIKPYEKNAKIHPDKQLLQIAKSIKEFGWRQPIVVDKTNTIIVGHGRWFAYEKFGKELGLKEPWIEKAEDLTEEQVKAYRLADNKSNESEWDMDLAIGELKGLSDEMLDLTGFDKDLLIEPDEKDDIVPENAPARAKTGDVWALGRHRVMCGDSTKKEDVERLMGGEKADMVFTDPPYGINLDTDYSSMVGISKGNKYKKVIGDNKRFDCSFLLDLSREVFLWGADYYVETLPNYGKDGSWFVWDKTEGGISPNSSYDKMFGSNFEMCWSKQKHKRQVLGFLWKGFFGLYKEDTKSRIHPTQKPVEMCLWFIKQFTKEKQLILDLFLGSGSTLIASEKTGRICYGMEIEPKYVDVIIKRYEDYTGNKATKVS